MDEKNMRPVQTLKEWANLISMIVLVISGIFSMRLTVSQISENQKSMIESIEKLSSSVEKLWIVVSDIKTDTKTNEVRIRLLEETKMRGKGN